MEKNYEVYYEPEGDVLEIYHKCDESFFKDSPSYKYELNFEIPKEDLELGVKVTKDGRELVLLVCEISKMSAYNPELLIDIRRIPIAGKIKFSLRNGDRSQVTEFDLTEDQIAYVKNFLEIE